MFADKYLIGINKNGAFLLLYNGKALALAADSYPLAIAMPYSGRLELDEMPFLCFSWPGQGGGGPIVITKAGGITLEDLLFPSS